MSHGSGEEENYWPGYVDALTSMVQVLAFVMMLLALAVYVLSQNVSRSAVVAISKAVEIKPDANATVEQLLGDVLAEVARLKALAANATARGETRPEEKGPGLESAATAALGSSSAPPPLAKACPKISASRIVEISSPRLSRSKYQPPSAVSP